MVEALTPEGIKHDQTYLPAAKEALKGTTLAGARVYLGGRRSDVLGHPGRRENGPDHRCHSSFRVDLPGDAAHHPGRRSRRWSSSEPWRFSYSGAFGLSVLLWQHIFGIPLSWLDLPLTFIILVAVGSDYNLLLIARYLEESKAGLNTGLIRAVANSRQGGHHRQDWSSPSP